MDDIALISDTPEGLQQMLNKVNQFILKWHLVISPSKTKIMIFSNKAASQKIQFKWMIGNLHVEITDRYKYLGEVLNSRLDLTTHVSTKKQLANMIISLSCAITGVEPLNLIRQKALQQFHSRCVIPSVLYGCQTWTTTEMPQLEDIQLNSLRRYLRLPDSTPKVSLLGETRNIYISSLIERYQLLYLWRILQAEGTLIHWVLNTQLTEYAQNPKTWAGHISNVLKKNGINLSINEIRLTPKGKWKTLVIAKTKAASDKRYQQESSSLKKLANLNLFKQEIREEPYLQLPREDSSIIFRLRTRMLPLKTNMRGRYNDTICPRCEEAEDTEIHLMTDCKPLENLRKKYNISGNTEVFLRTTTVTRLSEIASFIKECEVLETSKRS